jgi:hypothetical protein
MYTLVEPESPARITIEEYFARKFAALKIALKIALHGVAK